MGQDVSIVFKASDNLTKSIQDMRKGVLGLTKDINEYRRIESDAFEKRAEVKLDITKAKKELKELEKAIKNGTIYTPISFFSENLTPNLDKDTILNMSDEEFSLRAYSWRKRETILRNLEILSK